MKFISVNEQKFDLVNSIQLAFSMSLCDFNQFKSDGEKLIQMQMNDMVIVFEKAHGIKPVAD